MDLQSTSPHIILSVWYIMYVHNHIEPIRCIVMHLKSVDLYKQVSRRQYLKFFASHHHDASKAVFPQTATLTEDLAVQT